MEVDDRDLPTPAEHPGPQVDAPARRWIIAGGIIGALFVLTIMLRACDVF